jgi:hypothetical protein
MHVRERLEVVTRNEAEATCKNGARSLLAQYKLDIFRM